MGIVLLTIVVFVTAVVVIFSFAAAVATPTSVLGARLRSLGWERQGQPEKPAIQERLEQALNPLTKALPMSPTEASQTRVWLMQAGYREPRHATMYLGIRMLCALVGLVLVAGSGLGVDSPLLFVGVPAFGFFIPRFALKRR